MKKALFLAAMLAFTAIHWYAFAFSFACSQPQQLTMFPPNHAIGQAIGQAIGLAIQH